ncbi:MULTISPECIES: O-succinylhomoserine sulfhydrylase [Thiorhodovibrio]|uniref:O-succinylhomoserine sulfhydrylase n=1 Tax=Thiorhodovibrio TaxID=61593 RepID=UPI001912494E|nr:MULTISPECIES: O-succinylhomoserine sulfhydrylase [Thiorhodovibrio]MBK5970591.1 O-succinylhomoserine sulfhydrylase [Thiorhodovibrio winogradskyi]WPL12784.1 O-succinylhomoserine sulfhydrylase [Thiorhodovibrio litoralis]
MSEKNSPADPAAPAPAAEDVGPCVTPEQGFNTRALRVGHQRTAEGEHSEPIFATSSFVFASAAEAAARFSGDAPGNVYARFTNPTVQAFEQRLNALEGGAGCVATASGMAAILTMALGLLRSGDQILASRSLFGSTRMLFDKYLTRFGIDTCYVPLDDLDAWRAALAPRTKLLFVETPSNPLTEMTAIAPLAELAHQHGALLVVDNCFATPALQRPLEWGADLVIHSATKYLDGQGRCLGGAVIARDPKLVDEVFGVVRTAGPSMSPFNAWVFLKGLETLSLRMRAHSEAAQQLANWLSAHPNVTAVHYPGLPSHPQHHLIGRQMTRPGGILSFDVKGGRDAAWRAIDQTRMLSITANLGDTKTTITHPATTTHARLTPEERTTSGIGEGLIRLAVGLEDIADIQADLSRGLG